MGISSLIFILSLFFSTTLSSFAIDGPPELDKQLRGDCESQAAKKKLAKKNLEETKAKPKYTINPKLQRIFEKPSKAEDLFIELWAFLSTTSPLNHLDLELILEKLPKESCLSKDPQTKNYLYSIRGRFNESFNESRDHTDTLNIYAIVILIKAFDQLHLSSIPIKWEEWQTKAMKIIGSMFSWMDSYQEGYVKPIFDSLIRTKSASILFHSAIVENSIHLKYPKHSLEPLLSNLSLEWEKIKGVRVSKAIDPRNFTHYFVIEWIGFGLYPGQRFFLQPQDSPHGSDLNGVFLDNRIGSTLKLDDGRTISIALQPETGMHALSETYSNTNALYLAFREAIEEGQTRLHEISNKVRQYGMFSSVIGEKQKFLNKHLRQFQTEMLMTIQPLTESYEKLGKALPEAFVKLLELAKATTPTFDQWLQTLVNAEEALDAIELKPESNETKAPTTPKQEIQKPQPAPVQIVASPEPKSSTKLTENPELKAIFAKKINDEMRLKELWGFLTTKKPKLNNLDLELILSKTPRKPNIDVESIEPYISDITRRAEAYRNDLTLTYQAMIFFRALELFSLSSYPLKLDEYISRAIDINESIPYLISHQTRIALGQMFASFWSNRHHLLFRSAIELNNDLSSSQKTYFQKLISQFLPQLDFVNSSNVKGARLSLAKTSGSDDAEYLVIELLGQELLERERFFLLPLLQEKHANLNPVFFDNLKGTKLNLNDGRQLEIVEDHKTYLFKIVETHQSLDSIMRAIQDLLKEQMETIYTGMKTADHFHYIFKFFGRHNAYLRKHIKVMATKLVTSVTSLIEILDRFPTKSPTEGQTIHQMKLVLKDLLSLSKDETKDEHWNIEFWYIAFKNPLESDLFNDLQQRSYSLQLPNPPTISPKKSNETAAKIPVRPITQLYTPQNTPQNHALPIVFNLSTDELVELEKGKLWYRPQHIGSGGYGKVYSGHKKMGVGFIPVAIKIFDPALVSFSRSKVEAHMKNSIEGAERVLRKNNSPGIVVPLGYKITNVKTYAIYELVDGENLEQLVKRTKALSPQDTVFLITTVAQILRQVHEVVGHYDIKPGNILISRTGQIKITDFGTGSSELERKSRALVLSGPRSEEAPPVQTIELRPADFVDGDKTADLYALGISLFFAASGTYPERNDDLRALIPPEQAKLWGKEALDKLQNIYLKCATRKASRYPTAEALIEDLNELAGLLPSSLPNADLAKLFAEGISTEMVTVTAATIETATAIVTPPITTQAPKPIETVNLPDLNELTQNRTTTTVEPEPVNGRARSSQSTPE